MGGLPMTPNDTPHLNPNHRFLNIQSVWQALPSLLEGYQYAEDLQVSVWDFPLELETLLRAGCTLNALRWLVRRGYAAHSTPAGGGRGLPVRAIPSFPRDSCFVLTDAGADLARTMPASVSRAPSELPGAADARGAEPDRPLWDHEVGELSYRGLLVKRFRNAASNQRAVLDEFQRLGWPQQIVDPLPPDRGVN